jgi:hypothetical protein
VSTSAPPDRRRSALAALVAVLALLAGCTGTREPSPPAPPPRTTAAAAPVASTTGPPTTTAAALPQLPRGGRQLFPRWRVVAFYGGARGGTLGVLGEAPPERIGERVLAAARPFVAHGRPVMPAFELIATTANDHPGPSGRYRTRMDHAVIDRYLRAARALKGLLILDVQPGRSDFLTEVRQYERFLREPDVGLALDPEWSMGPGQVPGQAIGSTDAATVNRVSGWLAGLVERGRLPHKLLVIHQFTRTMVRDKDKVVRRPGLAMTFHVDGFGGQVDKRAKYRLFTRDGRWHNGFKLFYDEDVDLMTPAETMRLRPPPDLVTYQ